MLGWKHLTFLTLYCWMWSVHLLQSANPSLYSVHVLYLYCSSYWNISWTWHTIFPFLSGKMSHIWHCYYLYRITFYVMPALANMYLAPFVLCFDLSSLYHLAYVKALLWHFFPCTICCIILSTPKIVLWNVTSHLAQYVVLDLKTDLHHFLPQSYKVFIIPLLTKHT